MNLFDLYPGQFAAWCAKGRELLIGAPPRSGASHLLRVIALDRAWSTPGLHVVIAGPDRAFIRREHLEGEGGWWRMVEPAVASGEARHHAGGVTRFANGSAVQLTTWEAVGRLDPGLLLLDDADELGWGGYNLLRERALAVGPVAAGAPPRLVVVAKRPDEGWTRQHWSALNVDEGLRVDLKPEELPEALRGSADVEERKPISYRDYINRVHPGFDWHWHTGLIVETLQRVIDRELLRLLIFAPPRYGKSELVSRKLPAYQLHVRPDEWVGLGASTSSLARYLSKDARSTYREGGGVFREDTQDASLWRTENGGGMWARGVGGTILGLGFNLGIIDDPFSSRLDACRPTEQKRVEDWFWSDFYSRRQLGVDTAIVVMHQRLDERDLAGRLLEREADEKRAEGWTVLNLPAIKRPRRFAFAPTVRLVDDPREEEEPLCAALQTREELHRLEEADAFLFDAIYQQEPKPSAGGGVFDRLNFLPVGNPDVLAALRGDGISLTAIVEQLQKEGVLPPFHREVRAWDIAGSKNADGDSIAGVRGGSTLEPRRIYWLDSIARPIRPGEVKQLILRTARADGLGVEVVLPREPAAAGAIMIEDFEKALQAEGFRVVVVPTTGSKRMRALPHAGATTPLADGTPSRVHVLRGPWIDRFVEQHHAFDGLDGHADDEVDAAAYAYTVLAVQVARAYLGWSR